MNTKYILGTVLIIAIVVIGVAVFTTSNNSSTSTASVTPPASQSISTSVTSTSTPSTSSSTPTQTSYTMAQVAQHNNASSCWSAINGKVYDLTSWINQHPGGPEHILGICGSDGSAAFNTQHGGQERPESILEQFYIGELAS